MNVRNLALLAVLSLGMGLSACEKKNDGAMEKMGDSIGDATDSRDNENMKDAGEDIKDAAENVKEGAKDAVE